MKIPDLLLDKRFLLPIDQKNFKSGNGDSSFRFRKVLYSLFDDYLAELGKLDPDEFFDSSAVRDLVDSIKRSIDHYLEGHPYNAFDELKSAFERNRSFNSVLTRGVYDPASVNNFYRLRRNPKNFAFPRQDLFHIPFEKRGRISTQRYSIPGTPCLYVANSIYVAWEELRRPFLDEIQAARLQNVREIKYLDLVTDMYCGRKNLLRDNLDRLQDYVLMWPLVASCSVKVYSDEDSFKPEYIIPQLLLQLVRTEKSAEFDAIRFSSTHVNLSELEAEGNFYNLAIPVKESGKHTDEKGYCGELKNMFLMSDVVSWQLLQASSDNLIGRDAISNGNENVESIELITGKTTPYRYSPFYKLEAGLMQMELRPLTDL